MGLKGGTLGGHNLRLAGASGSLSLTFGNGGQLAPILQLSQFYGIPGGYSLGRGYVGPVKNGGLGALARGDASATANVSGYGNMVTQADGVASGTLTGFLTVSRTGTAAGIATSSAGASGIGRMEADLFIGSRPTADDIAQATRSLLRPLLETINQNVQDASLLVPATDDLP
jgi:hypothetical protein